MQEANYEDDFEDDFEEESEEDEEKGREEKSRESGSEERDENGNFNDDGATIDEMATYSTRRSELGYLSHHPQTSFVPPYCSFHATALQSAFATSTSLSPFPPLHRHLLTPVCPTVAA